MLSVHSLTFSYPKSPILFENLSFTVKAKSCLAILGPSGCGKSTLLKTIAGLESPHSGSVCWQGQEITNIPVHKRQFGMVFQEYSLFNHLDVVGNIGFGLRMQKSTKAEVTNAATYWMDKLHITELAHRPVWKLSGGQQQRVVFARALAARPRLLLLDEPFSSLDSDLRLHMQDILVDLLKEIKIPAILVTHDRWEAKRLGDQLIAF